LRAVKIKNRKGKRKKKRLDDDDDDDEEGGTLDRTWDLENRVEAEMSRNIVHIPYSQVIR